MLYTFVIVVSAVMKRTQTLASNHQRLDRCLCQRLRSRFLSPCMLPLGHTYQKFWLLRYDCKIAFEADFEQAKA